ncbi:MAG: NRDE family protein [Bacteroidetes bacterium]|jgi:uncharacterized protein with NRDE domain|nr:NRDE family protein [Bacteroidota bacterium]
MCTVTYIPQKEGFILTSNRDENAARSPKNLSRITQDGVELIFPRDTAAGGTWIAISETNRMVCVLNGAFKKHKHRPPYRRSRGLIVLDFFKYSNAKTFFKEYDFERIEPFTMFIFDNGDLFEFRWDEQEKHISILDKTEKYIWSSCTLYNPEWQEKRANWFNEWKEDQDDFSRDSILEFHKNGGEKDEWNGFIMNRMNMVQTVSITSISQTSKGFDMKYYDLVNEDMKQEQLIFKKNFVKI